jgi:peptidoglycan hydrolase CwlO-like protein
LDSATQRLHQLERQVVELESRLSAANDLNSELEADRTNDQAEIRRLQLDLAASQAAAETHDQFAAKIQAWISQTPKPTTDGPSVNQR